MKKIPSFLKKEPMLAVSLAAAVVAMFITPPGKALLGAIDWKTLATLFMLLSVLDGFKHENIFRPLLLLSARLKTQTGLTFFLVFGVFFSSMFVTNDVSLIIFVPLTILLFRGGGKERYILPVLALENIAAVRGSLLTPFGSPQNLFLYSESGVTTGEFMGMMLPLWLGSAVLLALFILWLYRKKPREPGVSVPELAEWEPERAGKRRLYLVLFVLVIATIVSRTSYWPAVLVVVTAALTLFDRDVFRRVDYVLLGTFFCFFVFSASIAGNERAAAFLSDSVAGREYWWSLALSQIISNVPASIVLQPFSADLRALLYGLDSAGLISVIGSLASVINLRLYTAEYPGRGKDFLRVFEIVSLAFFAIIVLPQYWLLRL